MAKNVFITGAAGFIGFHLAQALAKRGDRVLGYDNFNHYYPPELKRKRAALLKEAGVSIIEGDICDATTLQQALHKHNTTHLVNLAAQAGVRYSLTNPQAYIKANIEGFTNILEACRNHKDIKLIYASSSSVYGRNAKIPFSIEDRIDNQASVYGVTKKTNELLANTYHSLYGIPITGLRFFTVYGPWGRPDMAYFSFTEAILKGLPIEVYDAHQMKRDFTYIDDIIKGTIAAIDLGAAHELFNLGNNQPVALLDFIAVIEQTLEKRAKIKHLPMQAGDIPVTYADISHSTSKLGFVPSTTILEGIPRFVSWYKQQYG